MTRTRIALAASALGAALAAVALTGTPATADPGHRSGSAAVSGMAHMHELHMQGNPGMAHMHELHMQGNPGMARMHERMAEEPRAGRN